MNDDLFTYILSTGYYPTTISFDDRKKINQEILRGLKSGSIILPSAFIVALPKSKTAMDFRRETGICRYDVGLYLVMRKYMNTIIHTRRGDKERFSRLGMGRDYDESPLGPIASFLLETREYKQGIASLVYPPASFGLPNPINKMLQQPKEEFKENPCQTGIDFVMAVADKNDKLRAEYNASYDLYRTALSNWEDKRDKAHRTCSNFASRTGWLDWGMGKLNSSTIARNCDRKFLNTYGGRYKYSGTSSFDIRKGFRYECEFSNPTAVRDECNRRWDEKNAAPTKPPKLRLNPLPPFTCLDCSNTVNVSDGSSVKDTLLKLANTCVSKNTTSSNSTSDASTTNNTTDNSTSAKSNPSSGGMNDQTKYTWLGVGGLALLGLGILAGHESKR